MRTNEPPYVVPRVRLLMVHESSDTVHPAIMSSQAVWNTYREYFAGLDREQFWVLGVDGKNRPLFANRVSEGTLTASLVHAREVFKPAILGNAGAVMLMHNHPSGDPTPSAEDIALTTRMCDAGNLLGIRVLDHVVFGRDRYVSFNDAGLWGES